MSDILHIPVDRELSDRVRWLIRIRWWFIALGIAVVLVANQWLGGVLPLGRLALAFGGIILYNCLLVLIGHRMVSRTAPSEVQALLMHVQIFGDMLALTILLHFSGAIENPFSTYYLILVVVGSILMTRRDSHLYATVATLLWAGLLVAEASGVLAHYNLVGFRLPLRYRELTHIVAETFVLASANFGVAYLSSSLIERLRVEEKQLYGANAACELRAQELADLNQQLQEANASCEVRAEELADLNRKLAEANASCELHSQELVDLNVRLQELDHTRSLFIRLVTHELRAPVAAIQSYLRLILDGYVPAEREKEIVAKAEQRARDQLELISDLLDLARTQEPKDKYVAEPVDVAAILRDVADMLSARAQDQAITLTMEVAPDLPLVLANQEHVKQVWTNLISNAIKYTPNGGRITVSLCVQGEMVRGAVADTGIGIAPEDQARIFETFYRTEAAKAMAHHSTGLGLSIVKGIMERYHGRVWVESEIGHGSTFFFEFPKA